MYQHICRSFHLLLFSPARCAVIFDGGGSGPCGKNYWSSCCPRKVVRIQLMSKSTVNCVKQPLRLGDMACVHLVCRLGMGCV